ncbi:hypothetical protein ABZU32_12855 [Sphaerisporangium sp. NPDC005288]|uniref:Uncharacterized protein n=1 Tax=Sphaerisporangium rhizosphaerae TaxID=2269375 RepID=A0ABW2PF13_9ACTN
MHPPRTPAGSLPDRLDASMLALHLRFEGLPRFPVLPAKPLPRTATPAAPAVVAKI